MNNPKKVVDKLLETDLDWEPDPSDPDDQVKPLVNELPSKLNSAVDATIAEFNRRVKAYSVSALGEADEIALEVCDEARERYGFQNDKAGFDSILLAVGNRVSELFPGDYNDEYDDDVYDE